jgi:hypothetical protein
MKVPSIKRLPERGDRGSPVAIIEIQVSQAGGSNSDAGLMQILNLQGADTCRRSRDAGLL